MDHNTRAQILASTRFPSSSLSVHYLDIPLVYSRLTKSDCAALVNVIAARIIHWSARLIYYARRLQLVKFVLFGMQTYWSSMLILPVSIYKQIEQLISRFLG